MRRTLHLAFTVLVLAMVASPAMAQGNPCNPCGPKATNPGNPCGGKTKNPCNPCGGQSAAPQLVPVNPCHAKYGTVFHIADAMGRNQVTFTSQAPLEDIVGTTNQIVGYLVFDPDKPRRGVRGHVKVAVKSLNTGIPLRDEHLQSDMWLDAETSPDITFTIESTKDVYPTATTQAYQTYKMTLVGSFSIHGQTRQVQIPARITFLRESDKTRTKMPGNLLGVRAKFDVALADFGITGPAGMDLIGSKVGQTVGIEISAFASDTKTTAGNPGNPCNPCGGKAKNKAKNPCNPCGGKKDKGRTSR